MSEERHQLIAENLFITVVFQVSLYKKRINFYKKKSYVDTDTPVLDAS